MKHPNELDQQLDNLRTLQQSLDQVAGAAEAYNTGKPLLAQNITAKGVQASADETLPELAEKVAAISQETYEINGGEMYAKQLFGSLETPNYWNLYEVLEQLLSDGRLVQYGGILLAEYYKGYDSLALSGAGAGGAYVVSDKDSQGNFIMYTKDTTHVWDTAFDGKVNRWVAYCFADAAHDFQITDTNTSPRSIHIGRHVGTITSLVNGRVSEIVVTDGNILDDFITNPYSQNWGSFVAFRNIVSPSGQLLYILNANMKGAYIECGNISAPIIRMSGVLSSLIIKSQSINTTYINSDLQALEITTMIVDCPTVSASGTWFNAASRITTNYVGFLNINSLSISFQNANSGGIPKKVFLSGDNDKTHAANINSNSGNRTDCVIELDNGWCKSLSIPKYIMTEEQLVGYILQRLKQDEPDCGDGVTITLGQTNLDELTSEESVALLDELTNTYGYTFA